MSVSSIADERVERAREHIQEAIAELGHVLTDRHDGYEDYSSEHKTAIRSVFQRLLEIREEL